VEETLGLDVRMSTMRPGETRDAWMRGHQWGFERTRQKPSSELRVSSWEGTGSHFRSLDGLLQDGFIGFFFIAPAWCAGNHKNRSFGGGKRRGKVQERGGPKARPERSPGPVKNGGRYGKQSARRRKRYRANNNKGEGKRRV